MITSRPRVIFVNRYGYPDEAATSQLLSDLSTWLAGEGWDVTVIVANQLYTDPQRKLPHKETHKGVRILRISTTRFGRSNLLGRFFDYLTFYLLITFKLLFYVKSNDLIVAKTDPPLLGVPVSLVTKLRGAILYQWCQDIFPEIALGPKSQNSALWRIIQLPLQWLRNGSFKLSRKVIVLGKDMADFVQHQCKYNEKRIQIIPNWSDDSIIRPVPKEDNPLRTEWHLQDTFVVGYSGNLGRVHEYHTFLEATRILRNERDIRYVFIGSGALRKKLEADIPSELQQRFCFKPYQPRSDLSLSLSVPDVHWLCLHPDFKDLVFPSKYYGILAAGRPMLFIGEKKSHLANSIESHNIGYSIMTGDAQFLANRIMELKNDPQTLLAMGKDARYLCERECLFSQRANDWQKILSENLVSLSANESNIKHTT